MARLGRQAEVIENEEVSEAGKLASGVYLYRLEAGDFVAIKMMILMR